VNTLNDIQIAVLEDDKAEINTYLQELDRKTESKMYLQAAEHCGFKTVELHGRRFAMRAEIATVMGYKDESGLRKLCQRYDLETLSPASFGQNVRKLISNELGLHPKDGRSVLVTWDVFLLAGMAGTTDAAKQIKLYLLKMEKAGRVASGVVDGANRHDTGINRVEKIVKIVDRATRIPDIFAKNNMYKLLNKELAGIVRLPVQTELLPSDEKSS